MAHTEELSDIQHGTVIGCHFSNKSVRQISALLELPRSTVSAVVVKWKRLRPTTAQPRSGRPHKLTERDRRVLKHVKIVCPRLQHSLPSSKLPLEATSATRTVRRESHKMGFNGRAAAHKPKIPMRNAMCQLEWCKARLHWTLEQWKRILWNDESRFTIWPSNGRIWFGSYQENTTCLNA